MWSVDLDEEDRKKMPFIFHTTNEWEQKRFSWPKSNRGPRSPGIWGDEERGRNGWYSSAAGIPAANTWSQKGSFSFWKMSRARLGFAKAGFICDCGQRRLWQWKVHCWDIGLYVCQTSETCSRRATMKAKSLICVLRTFSSVFQRASARCESHQGTFIYSAMQWGLGCTLKCCLRKVEWYKTVKSSNFDRGRVSLGTYKRNWIVVEFNSQNISCKKIRHRLAPHIAWFWQSRPSIRAVVLRARRPGLIESAYKNMKSWLSGTCVGRSRWSASQVLHCERSWWYIRMLIVDEKVEDYEQKRVVCVMQVM